MSRPQLGEDEEEHNTGTQPPSGTTLKLNNQQAPQEPGCKC